MPVAEPIIGVAWEDGTAVLLGHLVNASGADMTVASISSINLIVEDEAVAGTVVGPSPYATPAQFATSDVVFDALQTRALNPIWTKNAAGFNFRYDVLNAQIPTGGKTYRFEFWFTPASGIRFVQVFKVQTRETRDD